MFPGQAVAVFATGSSMSQEVADEVRARGLPAIAVSDAFRLAPWASILYSADTKWWDANPDAADFAGIKVCNQQNNRTKGVVFIRGSGRLGFDPDPGAIRTGGNSGYQAVHVAIHTGAALILLFGFDMQGTHYFGPHRAPLRNTSPHSFRNWVDRFGALNGRGARIVNCSPSSALRCFPKQTLDEALRDFNQSNPPPGGFLVSGD